MRCIEESNNSLKKKTTINNVRKTAGKTNDSEQKCTIQAECTRNQASKLILQQKKTNNTQHDSCCMIEILLLFFFICQFGILDWFCLFIFTGWVCQENVHTQF